MKRQKLLMSLSRYCRIFMITFLLLTALLFIQGFIGDIIWDYYTDNSYYQPQELQREPVDRSQRIDSSKKMFLPDGTIHLVYTDLSQFYTSPSDHKYQVYDTNDDIIWQGNNEEYEKYSEKYLDLNPFVGILNYNPYDFESVNANARNSIILPLLKGRQKTGYWRYNNFGGYFAGFDSKNKIIGYCGSNGFIQKKSQIKSLSKPVFIRAWVSENNGAILMLWWTKHDIFQIDFKKQAVKTLLHLPDKEITSFGFKRSVMQLIENGTSLVSDSYEPLFICRTKDDFLFFISHNSNETNQIKLPEDIHSKALYYNATNDKLYIKLISVL